MSTSTQLHPPVQEHKSRNTVGLIALITAIVGAVFAVIPGAVIIGWILLPIAFVLSIISLFMKDQKRGQGIAALIISIVGTVIGFIVFFAVVATSVDEAFSEDVEIQSPADGATEADTESDEDASTDSEEHDAPSGEEGTRDNPLALGTTVESGDWEVTVNGVDLDATDAIMSENSFNEQPADGNVYVMADVTTTYIGSDPEGETPYISIEYVSSGGNSFASHDAMVVTPNDFDSFETLYEGASTSGNIAMEVPQEDLEAGTLRVSPGLFGDAVFYAVQ
ncbi:hypothetical protein GCM10023190_10790 [Enteractinococcus fodinae]|uniref:DUF4352 domain-containing protein n=1 Tax=Enteractinococcus fodinae TaxID=684663 RepID=A0ABU2B102_9MICC|nr:hypothetical protein [Enteractinococcus fodinae]MDR7346443.1 hypothetical protein [Enteractinococcus fodinae]